MTLADRFIVIEINVDKAVLDYQNIPKKSWVKTIEINIETIII